MTTKEECEQEARENRQLASRADREGRHDIANAARDRARDWDRSAESFLHRWFGL